MIQLEVWNPWVEQVYLEALFAIKIFHVGLDLGPPLAGEKGLVTGIEDSITVCRKIGFPYSILESWKSLSGLRA